MALMTTWRRECPLIQQDPFFSLNPRMRVALIFEELLAMTTMNRSAREQWIREVLDEIGLGSLLYASLSSSAFGRSAPADCGRADEKIAASGRRYCFVAIKEGVTA
ncbi:hypothetical protein [Raoultella terrigena]|uniref:hypothetical protein n=1 Tax=Raoultella terrigena TaxID=577 RepID=UPI001F3107FA|nr:hypothetical protein [Raoultella terrigena]MCE9901214.1 hypothetical protein [Raoultella terrigena]